MPFLLSNYTSTLELRCSPTPTSHNQPPNAGDVTLQAPMEAICAFVHTAGAASSAPSTWSATCARASPIHSLLPTSWLTREADTKEKPFVCRCGAAFARRDLLTRHQRVNLHEDDGEDVVVQEAIPLQRQPHRADADLAAAVSLSGLSVDNWSHLQPQMPLQVDDHGRNGRDPGFMSPQFLDGGAF